MLAGGLALVMLVCAAAPPPSARRRVCPHPAASQAGVLFVVVRMSSPRYEYAQNRPDLPGTQRLLRSARAMDAGEAAVARRAADAAPPPAPLAVVSAPTPTSMPTPSVRASPTPGSSAALEPPGRALPAVASQPTAPPPAALLSDKLPAPAPPQRVTRQPRLPIARARPTTAAAAHPEGMAAAAQGARRRSSNQRPLIALVVCTTTRKIPSPSVETIPLFTVLLPSFAATADPGRGGGGRRRWGAWWDG